MSRLLLILAGLLAAPVFAQPDWESIDVGTTDDLYALADFQRFAVAGANGFFAIADLATPTEWTTLNLGTTEDLLSIVRSGSQSYNVSGRNGTYRYSSDDAATWQSEDLPDTTQDYVLVRPNTTFFALGSAGSVYADRIGSPVLWESLPTGTTATLHDGDSASELLAVGDDGTILLADIAGETGGLVESGTTADLYAIERIGSVSGTWLIVGQDGLILKSIDNGETWTPRESGTTATLYELRRANVRGGITLYVALGENGTMLQTSDLGETWCALATGTTATLRAMATTRIDQVDRWLIAGDGGTMLYSETLGGGCVSVASEAAAPESGYTLSAAWPNPATHRAALSLTVDQPQHVTAEVLDLLGRRVAVLSDGPMVTDSAQTLTLERRGLAPGTYLVRVTGETFAASRRLTLL